MKAPERLKKLREEKGLNKRQLANDLRIPYSTYNNWETGTREMNSDALIQISYYYKVSIDYIMGLTNTKERHIEYALYTHEKNLIDNYRNLNDIGKNKVDNYIKDLSGNPIYCIEPEQNIPYDSAAFGSGDLSGELTPEENIEAIKAVRNIKKKKAESGN